jgi:hypothetical protein
MQLGKGTSLSIHLSRALVSCFCGSTSRMSMFSLTPIFVEFRLLRRSHATCA